jgi:mannose-1-phosphate guanylyltransferase/mannose-6-phosphate isomerase
MYPKQLLPLTSDKTMLQATALRIAGIRGASKRCLVVSNEAHRFAIAEQMNGIETRSSILLEPEGRNTAPAVALAAFEAATEDLLLVMPADHVIKNVGAFQAAVSAGMPAAEEGKLVTFGVVPREAETGYGYIKATTEGAGPVEVERFVEKPDFATAEAYLASGNYFWNSGMFLFRAGAFLEELEALAPLMYAACRKAMAAKTLDGDFVRPEPEAFRSSPSDSIDYAVMEKSANAVMVPLDAGWSDVGSWSALHDVSDKDEQGNSLEGDAHVVNCEGTFVQAESRLVAAIGLRNTVVVETKDAVLVADRDQCQDVKLVVDTLKAADRGEVLLGRQVFRPWGSYDSIDTEDNFQVKRLVIKPGAVLSLQKHAHRAEHWVCVKGKARITRNEEEFDLNPNESTFIAIGDIHRIANPYDQPCHIIEVQCGDYLGEDDIVRFEDDYGREGTNT